MRVIGLDLDDKGVLVCINIRSPFGLLGITQGPIL